jgi:hypothetical protein
MTEKRDRQSSCKPEASYREDVRSHLGRMKPWRVKAHHRARRGRGQS